MFDPSLYPVSGVYKIVDPFKKTEHYQRRTDSGVRRLSKREAERLIAAEADRRVDKPTGRSAA